MTEKNKNNTVDHFINGEWVSSSTGETFDDLNPLDDSVYGTVAKGSKDDVMRAVSSAKSAFIEYRNTLPTERERMLLKVAEIMERRKSDLIDCLIDEIGSPLQKAMFEFGKSLTMVRAAAGLCRNVRGETIPSDAQENFQCR